MDESGFHFIMSPVIATYMVTKVLAIKVEEDDFEYEKYEYGG